MRYKEMLEELHPAVRILNNKPGAHSTEIAAMRRRYPGLPRVFIELFAEATEIELSYRGKYLRFYGPTGCAEMDDAYGISKLIPGAIPVGDNGGGESIIVIPQGSAAGLHRVGYGALTPEDLLFVAPTLESLLFEARPEALAVGSCEAKE